MTERAPKSKQSISQKKGTSVDEEWGLQPDESARGKLIFNKLKGDDLHLLNNQDPSLPRRQLMSKHRLGIDGLVDDVLNDYQRTRRTDNFSYSPRGGVAKANTGLTQYYENNSETHNYQG